MGAGAFGKSSSLGRRGGRDLRRSNTRTFLLPTIRIFVLRSPSSAIPAGNRLASEARASSYPQIPVDPRRETGGSGSCATGGGPPTPMGSGLRRKDGGGGFRLPTGRLLQSQSVNELPDIYRNDIWGARNGSGKRIWRMLGGTVVDHDSRSARRFKWGSWMAKSQL